MTFFYHLLMRMKFSRETATLHLSDFLTPPQRFLVASTHISTHSRTNSHRHDFAEFFWVTAGTCEHGFDGGSEILEKGDLRFVCPEHAHEFAPLDADGAQLTNIALAADFIPAWIKSYPSLAGHFFWSTAGHPEGHRLTKERAARLTHAAADLARETFHLMVLHHFMMRLFMESLGERHDAPHLPSWLKRGIEKLPAVSVFTAGVPGFVKACGRSPEHVSRATRKHLATTPGELVNRTRMHYAAQQLRMTDENILNIMMDCGLNNPSHFYALFRVHYGETPRQYRLHRQGLVGQPKE
jgi:AraC family cel operon transcriptional repressor